MQTCLKTQVAPLKCQTILHLELCGALLLSQVIAYVNKVHKAQGCTRGCITRLYLIWQAVNYTFGLTARLSSIGLTEIP